ncbi:MAG: DNA-protecting protein DprA [Chloroflexi bacterium]|nr:DNA-protecting protein DprA [Chloroflexota bacterium]
MTPQIYWVLLSLAPGLGPVRIKRLIEFFGEPEAAWRAPESALLAAGLDRRTIEGIVASRKKWVPERVWERLTGLGAKVVTLGDGTYPVLLREIPDPPVVLYYRGSIEPADRFSVAVVGTRKATSYGRQAAGVMATELARAGVTVVSGLARGIDGEAHSAALRAGGRTIAVLGSGLDRIYPSEHQGLARQIAERGAVVTEYPPGTKPDAVNFPRRNRVIAGLCLATLVVEGQATSGSMITALLALEQGRDVYAVPGEIFSPAAEGPLRLIRDGAKPAISPEDVLEDLNLTAAVESREIVEAIPADPTEAAVARALAAEALHVDEIARTVELPMSQVSAALLLMELRGLVRQVGAGTYARS